MKLFRAGDKTLVYANSNDQPDEELAGCIWDTKRNSQWPNPIAKRNYEMMNRRETPSATDCDNI
jgi:hypothetical protein